MSIGIEHAEYRSKPFGDYRYNIYKDGQLVAHYWYDYRGDDHAIEFNNGKSDDLPALRMVEFLTGGGSEPRKLSKTAISYIDQILTQ